MNPIGNPVYLPGVDVSHFQGVIDWQRVKAAGIGFAFIKATDGDQFVDPQLDENTSQCAALGIPFGLYHFFRPSISVAAQAAFFLKHRKCSSIAQLPPALDLEIGPVSALDASDWLDLVYEEIGREPLIYTAPVFARDNFGTSNAMGVYPLWIAEYTTKSEPLVPNAWSSWDFWQHTPSGHVDGIPNAVDLDWFQGTAEDLITWLK